MKGGAGSGAWPTVKVNPLSTAMVPAAARLYGRNSSDIDKPSHPCPPKEPSGPPGIAGHLPRQSPEHNHHQSSSWPSRPPALSFRNLLAHGEVSFSLQRHKGLHTRVILCFYSSIPYSRRRHRNPRPRANPNLPTPPCQSSLSSLQCLTSPHSSHGGFSQIARSKTEVNLGPPHFHRSQGRHPR